MIETIASIAPAWILYVVSGVAGLFGVLTIWFPWFGLPLLVLAFISYLAAGVAKRKAREIVVRRQQGG